MTNVAETSLTVPGIKHVIDPGTAHQPLQLPDQGAASARLSQSLRPLLTSVKGRCGRVSKGSQHSSLFRRRFSRPEFTDPEILRTNPAASVILQMTARWASEILPPSRSSKRRISRNIRTARASLLYELGRLPTSSRPFYKLTPMGRQLSQLPVDLRAWRGWCWKAQNMAACVKR